MLLSGDKQKSLTPPTVAIDPTAISAANFAVMHSGAFSTMVW
jgi:hypothetical protein